MYRTPTRPSAARRIFRLCLPLLLVVSGWLGIAIRVVSAQAFDAFGVLLRPEDAITALPGDRSVADCGEAVPEVLALADAIRVALCNNPRTRQAWHEAAAQAAQVGVSRGAYLPNVSAGASASYDVLRSGTSPADPNHVNGANLTVSWLLMDSGARAANVEQAQHNLAGAFAQRDALVQQLFVAAAQAWYEAAAAQAAVHAASEAEATAQQSAEAAEFKSQRGAATVVDALQARTAAAQATLVRVRAQGQARTTLGALANVLGVDVRRPLALAADAALDPGSPLDAVPVDAFLGDLDRLIDEAVAAHPSLQAARASVAAAEARLVATRAEGFPTISLTHSNFTNGRPGTTLPTSRTHERITAITLNFPIFEGLSRNYRLHEQRAQVEARRAELAGQQSQVAYEVWRAYEVLKVESSSLKASSELMRSAIESLQAARARYQAGAADTIELLNAQKDEASARQERIQALASWRVSRLRLLAGLGRLGFWALDA
ncbi:MAG: TolC family protein [Burkholderiales bacterium]|jgi:outer membrane protein|nr:TolC family protein [Burkholderiales bacterium]